MIIINLTQHTASADQIAAGVIDPPAKVGEFMRRVMTFDVIPTKNDLLETAETTAAIAAVTDLSDNDDSDGVYATHAMIGGAPFFMSALETALISVGITPIYAFSVRDSFEETQPDGSVRKINVFRHAGFVGL